MAFSDTSSRYVVFDNNDVTSLNIQGDGGGNFNVIIAGNGYNIGTIDTRSHRVAICGKGGNVSAYLDGAAKQTVTLSAITSNPNIYLGNRSSDFARQFVGTIYDVTIYSRKLTQPEVALDAVNPYGTPSNPRFLYQGLRAWFVPSSGVTPSFKPYWIPKRSRIIGGGLSVS